MMTALLVLAAGAAPVRATILWGGGPLPRGDSPRADCYLVTEVAGSAPAVREKTLKCTDGDPSCDQDGACNGRCLFRARVCIDQGGMPRCDPPPALEGIRFNGRCPLVKPGSLSGSACGAFVDVDVPLETARRRPRAGRVRCRARATAAGGVRPRHDRDVFRLKCLPNEGPCPPQPTTTVPVATTITTNSTTTSTTTTTSTSTTTTMQVCPPGLSEQQKLVGQAPEGDFGISVAISQDTAVIGAPFANDSHGAAQIFVRSGTTWTQQGPTLTGGPPVDNFGISVAIEGDTAVFGAPNADTGRGAVSIFVRSGTSWGLQAKLAGVTDNGGLGQSVAISGDTVAVGAPGVSSIPGAAVIFVRSGTTWAQQGPTLTGAAAGDAFGQSVALSGDTAVVGAPDTDVLPGAASIFVRSGGAWSQQGPTLTGVAAGDLFGASVAISGDTVVVGAPTANVNRGAVSAFVRSGTTWIQQGPTLTGAAAGDLFGLSVAISGDTLVVGVRGVNGGRGAVSIFARSGTNWTLQQTLTASDAAPDDVFGASVAISGTTVVVGAPGKDSGTGAAYVFACPP